MSEILELMVPILVLGGIFGLPWYAARNRRLLREAELRAASDRGDAAALAETVKELQARVETLETIVTDVDAPQFRVDARQTAELPADQPSADRSELRAARHRAR